MLSASIIPARYECMNGWMKIYQYRAYGRYRKMKMKSRFYIYTIKEKKNKTICDKKGVWIGEHKIKLG